MSFSRLCPRITFPGFPDASFPEKEIVVITGDPGTGKTILLLRMIASLKKRTLYIENQTSLSEVRVLAERIGLQKQAMSRIALATQDNIDSGMADGIANQYEVFALDAAHDQRDIEGVHDLLAGSSIKLAVVIVNTTKKRPEDDPRFNSGWAHTNVLIETSKDNKGNLVWSYLRHRFGRVGFIDYVLPKSLRKAPKR